MHELLAEEDWDSLKMMMSGGHVYRAASLPAHTATRSVRLVCLRGMRRVACCARRARLAAVEAPHLPSAAADRRFRCTPSWPPSCAAKLLAAFKDTAESYHSNGLVWRTALSGGVEAGLRGIGFASKQQMAIFDEEQVGGWLRCGTGGRQWLLLGKWGLCQ